MNPMRASVLLLLCAALGARGAALYVDSRVDPNADHDGASPETAFATLDDAAAAAGDGDEVRIVGGEGRTYEFAADTNGTLFAQACLRLVGWGGEPPVLRADPDVLRSEGQRLLRIAGEGSVVSNLCIRFTQYSAGPAVVLSVEAPRVSLQRCSFELVDGPAEAGKGGWAGVVSCERGMSTDLSVVGCAFLGTRTIQPYHEYRTIMPRNGAVISGCLFSNVNAAVVCRKLTKDLDNQNQFTGSISFVSNIVVDSHCWAGSSVGGVINMKWDGPRTAEIAFNRFVNSFEIPSGAVVRNVSSANSVCSIHHNTVIGYEALISTGLDGNKPVANQVTARIFDNLLANVTFAFRENNNNGATGFKNGGGSFFRYNAFPGTLSLFGGVATTNASYAANVGAALAVEGSIPISPPFLFIRTKNPANASFYRWDTRNGQPLDSAGWTDGGKWPAWIGALEPREGHPPPTVIAVGEPPGDGGGGGGGVPPHLEPGGVWRVTVLDPTHLAVQGDFSGDERAAFHLTPHELQLSGWKFDNAFYAAADRAIEGRAAREAALRAGPFVVANHAVATNGFWKNPNGLMRFYYPNGWEKPARTARLLYTVFLGLEEPLAEGEESSIGLPDGTTLAFTNNPAVPSPLFKVNQVGYEVAATNRYVYLGGWLGSLGPWPAPAAGTTFELVDAASGAVVLTGPLVKRMEDPKRNGEETPFCGEDVREMDVSAAPAGRYYVRVEGVGRSMAFDIGRDGLGKAFALHMKGLYHQRCGCAKTSDLTGWTDDACHLQVKRGINPPGEWEYESRFFDATNGPYKTTHFKVNSAMMDSYTEELSLPGGWHDAADYDRRPHHLRIVGDLATVYLLRPQNFSDSQLAVPERGNGIPDILDEAVWGLKHLIAGQQADGGVGTWIEGTRHPNEEDRSMPSADPVRYCLARATRASSAEYAGYAALVARALLTVQNADAAALASSFSDSAVRAWNYYMTNAPAARVPMLSHEGSDKDVHVFYYEEDKEPNPEFIAKAAMNLYALTGEQKYADAFTNLVDGAGNPLRARLSKNGWNMSPLVLAEFGFTPQVPGAAFQALRTDWINRTKKEADAYVKRGAESYPYRLPWYGANEPWVHTMGWGQVHPLRVSLKFVAAHALTGERKYLDAAYAANDYHCGCNPNGETFTAGLGTVYPSSYLSLASCADGVGEYVPGISPYRLTYGLPLKAKEWVWNWDEDEIRSFPFLRRWANVEGQTVALSEFTVWETVSPAAAVTGYLMEPGLSPPVDNRAPVQDVRDLPGYWALP